MAGETYAGVYFIKAAIERAGTTDANMVIAAVEKEPLAWETPEGWKVMQSADHSVVDCYFEPLITQQMKASGSPEG